MNMFAGDPTRSASLVEPACTAGVTTVSAPTTTVASPNDATRAIPEAILDGKLIMKADSHPTACYQEVHPFCATALLRGNSAEAGQ